MGSLVNWPTLPTLLMFPILAVVYRRLAIREERENLERHGDRLRVLSGGDRSFSFPNASRARAPPSPALRDVRLNARV